MGIASGTKRPRNDSTDELEALSAEQPWGLLRAQNALAMTVPTDLP
jgi:hypothetical protein